MAALRLGSVQNVSHEAEQKVRSRKGADALITSKKNRETEIPSKVPGDKKAHDIYLEAGSTDKVPTVREEGLRYLSLSP